MRRKKLQDFVVNNLSLKQDDEDDRNLIFSTKAKVLVHSLAFFLPAGSFIKDKNFAGDFKIRYDKKLSQLQFDSIDIKLSGHPFNLSGSFHLIGANPQFTLKVHTKKIPFSFAKSLLTELGLPFKKN